jgi:4-amino-4-deoxychorismate lyase
LQFGDGLFETIACRRGRARFLAWHLERLAQGCERLRIRLQSVAEVRDEVRRLAQEVDSAIIKVMLTRGVAIARGYAPRGSEKPTRITFRYAWPSEDRAARQDGVRVRVAALRLGENPALAGLKHLNRLEQVLANAEFMETGAAGEPSAESLLFSSSGRLVSGTMTNVFLVRSSRVRTPRMDLCGVAGVMRRVVLAEAARAGVAAEESALRAEDLENAEEVFLTNARIGIWPVRAIGGRVLSPGPITRRLQQHLEPMLENPSDA